MDFLKDELSGLPASASKAILAELEAIVRSARYAVTAEQESMQSQRINARIAAVMQFALRFKEILATQNKEQK